MRAIHDEGFVGEIVQCKNQRKPLSKPDLIRELLKLALHQLLDPAILGDGFVLVRYEIWCTGDFTEQAALLVDTWPACWNEESVNPQFSEVIEEYKTLSALQWASTHNQVLEKFPSRIDVSKLNPVDITVIVRAHPHI